MEPIANFEYPALTRFEVTNVDVAALSDMGWSVIDNQPQTPAPVEILSIVLAAGKSVTLAWRSEPKASYTVQTSTNLVSWFSITPEVPSEGATTDWRDGEPGYSGSQPPSAGAANKYYRVIQN